MGKVAADALALGMAFRGGAVGAGMLIAERDALMGVIQDGLDPRPARLDLAEHLPGQGRQLVGVAIAAAQQIDQHLVGQVIDLRLRAPSRA